MYWTKKFYYKGYSKIILFLCGILTVLFFSDDIYAQNLNLTINSGTIIQLTRAEGAMDDIICKNGRNQCKGTEYNPICLFTDKDGDIAIAEGSEVAIQNNSYAYNENDMVINAGDQPIKILGVNLEKGEYGVVKNGVLEKSPGNLISGTEEKSAE